MDWWQVILVVIAAIALIAIIRNLRKQSAQAAEQRKVDEFRQLQARAAAADRAEQAALAAAAAPAAPILVDEPTSVERSRGFLQDAADTASGHHYERAASAMDEAAAELEQARREADRAAQRLAGRADEALASIQAAASAYGGAVPGDGTHECPPDYPVKGNMPSMRYHLPGQPSYGRTIPEVCFQNAAAAEAAGFTESGDETGMRGGVVVEDVVAGEIVTGQDREPLEAAVAEAILIRDREDAARGDIVEEAIAAADAGGVPPGAVRGDGSRDCPPAYPIKASQAAKRFLEPGSPAYDATIPELCFSSAASAQAAGLSGSRS